MPGNDCPWLASDPQLLAAATADHHREKQQDQFEDSPLGGDEHTRIANEMVWLVRRGG